MRRDEVKQLVETELGRMGSPERRAALEADLVEPVSHVRTWAYGPGEFECWTVARGPKGILCQRTPIAA